jgi:exosome complex component RRP4
MKNEINEAHEAIDDNSEGFSKTKSERKLVVPGEIVVTGEDYLPGEGARRDGENIMASRFGLSEEAGKVIRVIPIFGAFIPRRNNVVIGTVSDISYRGWIIDIDSASSAFLPIDEAPRFINKNEMDQYLAIGDVISAKIWSVSSRGIDLSLKGKGLGKLEGGFIFKVIPSRVPRVIGREGSMVNLIKEKTNTLITIGQNGWIWIKGDNTDSEIRARNAVFHVTEQVHINGLTDKMEEYFEKN